MFGRVNFLILFALLALGHAISHKLSMKLVRKAMLKTGVLVSSFGMMTNAAFADLSPAPWNKDIKYEVIEKGNGASVKPGELVAIRFKGSYKGNVFDNTFATDQPYFYRAGVGLILPGLDETVVNMHVGDKFKLNFGGELSFKDGRPSSPGKPRIPPLADVDYEVLLEDLPGTGDDFIADVE